MTVAEHGVEAQQFGPIALGFDIVPLVGLMYKHLGSEGENEMLTDASGGVMVGDNVYKYAVEKGMAPEIYCTPTSATIIMSVAVGELGEVAITTV